MAFAAFKITGNQTAAQSVQLLTGILLGTLCWWSVLSGITAIFRERVNDRVYQVLNKLLGCLMVVFGFHPGTMEPDEGWMGDLANGLLRLGRELERSENLLPLQALSTWTDSKQRRREALKKLAMGQKLSSDTPAQGMTMSM